MGRVPDGVTVSLRVTRIRIDFVTSKDDRALIINKKVSRDCEGTKTNRRE